MTVMGTYDEAPDAVRAWLRAGADAIDLVLPLGLPVEQLHEMLEAAALAAPPGASKAPQARRFVAALQVSTAGIHRSARCSRQVISRSSLARMGGVRSGHLR